VRALADRLEQVCECWKQLLRTEVRVVSRLGQQVPEPQAGSVGLRLERDFLVVLDEGAARALLDALAKVSGAFHGHGPATRVERAGLEFLAARTLERLAEASAPGRTGAWPHLVEVIGTSGLAGTPRPAGEAIGFELAAAGRAGRAALFGLHTNTTREPLFARADRRFELRAALPVIHLTEEEVAALAPGSVLLLGIPAPLQYPLPVELVTTTGWSVARADLRNLSSSGAEVEVGPCDRDAAVLPENSAVGDATGEPIRVTIGGASLDEHGWWPWPEGQGRTLALEPGGRALLHRRSRPAAEVELVLHDRELAVRLLTP
jgi:hypothetical protein